MKEKVIKWESVWNREWSNGKSDWKRKKLNERVIERESNRKRKGLKDKVIGIERD